jgi:glycosyltransferase involved in cell wall biosynthesis
MKILLVHKFWRKLSGAEMYFHDVLRILKQEGHAVKVFTSNLNAEGGRDEKENNEEIIYGTPVDYHHGSLIKRMTKLPEIIYSKKNKAAMAKLLDDFQPDIVHVFAIYVTLTPSILEACKEKSIPVVMSCNDYKHICTNYRLYHHGHICTDCKGGKLYSPVLNNCCKYSIAFSIASAAEAYVYHITNIFRKNVNVFLFESKFMVNITNEFWGDTFKWRLIGKPFHAPSFQPSYEYENYLLYIGRLSDEKGIDVLLKAMQLVPEAKLKIVGAGTEKANLEKIVTELKLNNVEFAGSKWGEEAKDQIRAARFVVIPSLWHENFPYVVTESYALGKSLIVSDKGGLPEYTFEGITGHVYPSDDYKKLSELIRFMWNNESDTIQKGKNAKKYADENFNDSVFYKKLIEAYDFAINKRPVEISSN